MDKLKFIETSDMYGTIWRVPDGVTLVEPDSMGFGGEGINEWAIAIEHEVGVKELRVNIDDALLTPAEMRALAAKLIEVADYADKQHDLEMQ